MTIEKKLHDITFFTKPANTIISQWVKLEELQLEVRQIGLLKESSARRETKDFSTFIMTDSCSVLFLKDDIKNAKMIVANIHGEAYLRKKIMMICKWLLPNPRGFLILME